MMWSLYNLLIIFILLSSCSAKTNSLDVIGFPEVEENPDIKNKEVRSLKFVFLLMFFVI